MDDETNLPTRSETDEDDEEQELHPIVEQILDLLDSPRGKEISDQIFKEISERREMAKTIQLKSEETKTLATKYGYAIILLIIVASAVLHFIGKFDGQIAILFGGIVGYLFGRQKNN